ncbi:mitochondrial ATP synthase epsilon chain domain-containing protein [Nadsonia fulvescens var. elongata DSM 6958]|uniref:Mitochondrial ATP synthase epsilon chain domain-containing protein n=1 Tax=Nadsonia fulvescens var. elongata DSM 6958 TaxID=857566 RepID=A0A1E3PUC9_9ASCO|nr:mitochondrial ATP synthase epsilon chain domain-containing protein [Nadsonia fulvescens var. elongata DSM 6958]
MSAPAWKAAGYTYNQYAAIAARTLRKALKPENRAAAAARDVFETKAAKWVDGKQLEPKTLSL